MKQEYIVQNITVIFVEPPVLKIIKIFEYQVKQFVREVGDVQLAKCLLAKIMNVLKHIVAYVNQIKKETDTCVTWPPY